VSGAGSGFGGGREIGVSTPPELPPFVATEKSAELLPWKSLPAEKPLPPGAWAGPGRGAARGRACPCASKAQKPQTLGVWGRMEPGAPRVGPGRTTGHAVMSRHRSRPHGCEGTSDAPRGEELKLKCNPCHCRGAMSRDAADPPGSQATVGGGRGGDEVARPPGWVCAPPLPPQPGCCEREEMFSGLRRRWCFGVEQRRQSLC